MSIDSGSATLRLTFSTSGPIPMPGIPSLTIAATLVDLGILYDVASKAWEYELPLVGLLEALRHKPTSDPDALDRPQDLSAYHWTAARLLPADRALPPTIDPGRLAQLQEIAVLHRTAEILLLMQIAGVEPLTVELHVPATYLRDSGGFWVFLQAIEHVYGTGENTNAQPPRLSTSSQSQQRADERRAIALNGVELLGRDTAGVKLITKQFTPADGST